MSISIKDVIPEVKRIKRIAIINPSRKIAKIKTKIYISPEANPNLKNKPKIISYKIPTDKRYEEWFNKEYKDSIKTLLTNGKAHNIIDIALGCNIAKSKSLFLDFEKILIKRMLTDIKASVMLYENIDYYFIKQKC